MAARRQRMDVDERRAELLRIGLELFGKSSYDELSIDDIARAAGISKGLLYHYFPSKREFYIAALSVAAQELLSHLEIESSDEPLTDLARGIEAYLDYIEAHAQAYVTLFRGGIGYDREVSAIVERVRTELLERMLSRFVDAAPRVRNAFRGYIGFVEAAALDWLEHRDVDRAELSAFLLRVAAITVTALGES